MLKANIEHYEADLVRECIGGERVILCGDFKDWQSTSLRMIGKVDAALGESRLGLPASRFESQFVVDDKWLKDPAAREKVPNIHGLPTSAKEVRL